MFSNSHQVWAQRIKTEQREAAKYFNIHFETTLTIIDLLIELRKNKAEKLICTRRTIRNRPLFVSLII